MMSSVTSIAMDMEMETESESPLSPLNVTQALWELAMSTTSETPFSDDNNNSIAVTEISYVPYARRPETYIVPILFAIIFVVGVLGNGTLIVVFLSVRQMRNVPNTYILSLALADLLVILTTVPLVSTVYTFEYWPWGSFLCSVSEFMKDVSIGVSVFTLTALSSDRYFAIVDPLRKFHAHGGGRRATRMTLAIAVSIWLLAIVCGLPALIGSNLKPLGISSEKSIVICYPYPDTWGENYAKLMVMLHFLVYYAIPLVIIAAFYVMIALHLMYSASVPGEMQGAVRQISILSWHQWTAQEAQSAQRHLLHASQYLADQHSLQALPVPSLLLSEHNAAQLSLAGDNYYDAAQRSLQHGRASQRGGSRLRVYAPRRVRSSQGSTAVAAAAGVAPKLSR
ncbi:neuropeptide CCHamide-1 receptor isoform X2 [Drosophila hydei]|uniref:Neuropeptide CCHamide-1 receptor isoform X2 n=1 Tax=Drosophila hydei TaxID=7224 RepID=A0A6J1LLK3_DROHY|nr:neuropeptide CCHamide-1 receptor isoform X2 [Drosophila hydei]